MSGIAQSASAEPATHTVCADCTYVTIQSAIDAATAGDTIEVGAGTYVEDVSVNKAVTLNGAGAATTSIVATTKNATTLTFRADDATVSGFTITHVYTVDELSAWNFNNNGVLFQNHTGNTLKNSTVALNRNGLYLNAAQSNTITGNTITNNRTGISLTRDFEGAQITDNVISQNWTLGIIMYGPSVVDLSKVTVERNTFDQNWYGQLLVKSPNHESTAGFTGILNVTDNSFTDLPTTPSTSGDAALDEPGFAGQRPVSLGGTATAPATSWPALRIYGTPGASLEYKGPLSVVSNPTTPTVEVTDSTQPLVVVVDSGTEDAGVDYSALLTGGANTIPQTTIVTSDGVTVEIPQTSITSTDSSWNGVIKAPTVVPNSSVTIPAESGTTVTVATAIEVGAGAIGLTFDKGVRLLLPGQTDKLVGFVRNGTFTPITTKCSADSQTVGDALAAGDCYISVGADMVIWTKHFTTFVAYSSAVASGGTPVIPTVDRRSGLNRYDTAVDISEQTFNPGVDAVYVANGAGFADGLAGGPGAAKDGGPILLTPTNRFPQSVVDEITRLDPAKIIVLGGTASISHTVKTKLGTLAPVTRAGGANRFGTAAAVANRWWATADVVYLANGLEFPDALSGGGLAATQGAPLLLTKPGALPAETVAALKRLKPTRVVIIGGPAVVTDTVKAAVGKLLPSAVVTRIGGDDRYATSAKALEASGNHKTGKLVLASGEGFADALAGVPAAAKLHVGFALTKPACLPQTVATVVGSYPITGYYLLGGTGVLNNTVTTTTCTN